MTLCLLSGYTYAHKKSDFTLWLCEDVILMRANTLPSSSAWYRVSSCVSNISSPRVSRLDGCDKYIISAPSKVRITWIRGDLLLCGKVSTYYFKIEQASYRYILYHRCFSHRDVDEKTLRSQQVSITACNGVSMDTLAKTGAVLLLHERVYEPHCLK